MRYQRLTRVFMLFAALLAILVFVMSALQESVSSNLVSPLSMSSYRPEPPEDDAASFHADLFSETESDYRIHSAMAVGHFFATSSVIFYQPAKFDHEAPIAFAEEPFCWSSPPVLLTDPRGSGLDGWPDSFAIDQMDELASSLQAAVSAVPLPGLFQEQLQPDHLTLPHYPPRMGPFSSVSESPYGGTPQVGSSMPSVGSPLDGPPQNVPEPGTFLLLGTALVCLALYLRLRKRRQKK